MNKKFELTTDTIIFLGRKLFRIKALINFGNIKKDDLGGYVEKESNLAHDGNAWVYGNAEVCGDAEVYGNAEVCGNAWVYGNADYLCFKGFGSENRNTTFFKCNDGHVHVSCGCFSGTLSEFEQKVKETHGENKFAKEYLTAIELVKIHFEIER